MKILILQSLGNSRLDLHKADSPCRSLGARAVGRSENLVGEGISNVVGIICPHPVIEIGLTNLSKSGGGEHSGSEIALAVAFTTDEKHCWHNWVKPYLEKHSCLDSYFHQNTNVNDKKNLNSYNNNKNVFSGQIRTYVILFLVSTTHSFLLNKHVRKNKHEIYNKIKLW